jgi:RNA recognition motif-containing protein
MVFWSAEFCLATCPIVSSSYANSFKSDTFWLTTDHMRKAGNVDQATILSDSQGNSIGCAVVVYQRPQEAARAIRELQNSDLAGRNIYLREDRNHGASTGGGGSGSGGGGSGGRHFGGDKGGHSQGGRGHSHRGDKAEKVVVSSAGDKASHAQGGAALFVNNLSYETSWQDLKDHFRQCGDVERAEVFTNAEGRSKGFGTVRFFKEKDAEAAIEKLNGQELQGRTLEVRYDTKSR